MTRPRPQSWRVWELRWTQAIWLQSPFSTTKRCCSLPSFCSVSQETSSHLNSFCIRKGVFEITLSSPHLLDEDPETQVSLRTCPAPRSLNLFSAHHAIHPHHIMGVRPCSKQVPRPLLQPWWRLAEKMGAQFPYHRDRCFRATVNRPRLRLWRGKNSVPISPRKATLSGLLNSKTRPFQSDSGAFFLTCSAFICLCWDQKNNSTSREALGANWEFFIRDTAWLRTTPDD